MTKKEKKNRIIGYVLIGLIYLIAFFCIILCNWAKDTFDVTIESALFTLTNPMKGSNNDSVKEAVIYCLPRLLIFVAIIVTICIFDYKNKTKITMTTNFKKRSKSIDFNRFMRRLVAWCSVFAFIFSLAYADSSFEISKYFIARLHNSTIYEEYYINPNDVNITLSDAESSGKNLIHIYLESMETIYSSTAEGGGQTVNLIPNLTDYAKNNISFSNTEKLGGFLNTSGNSWTMGSLMSQTSGVPYNFPINKNSMNKCAPGLTCLGDILAKFDYNQMFLCGSDADFAGRKAYYKQHGNYDVLDYYAAINKGYIDEDYYVFWGFEDNILFNIAKEEITRLASENKPFNFEMLTVDTHTKNGYICDLCNANEYDNQIANVIKCSDRQVYAFVEWCKQQDFYDNTVIIITGDHQLMNPSMVKHLDDYENLVRPVYNCFINCGKSGDYNTTNRTFTPMDIFPTTLSALGFTWDGDYLGLGTNMFSSSKTLAETIGYDKLYSELQKSSKYYVKNFS